MRRRGYKGASLTVPGSGKVNTRISRRARRLVALRPSRQRSHPATLGIFREGAQVLRCCMSETPSPTRAASAPSSQLISGSSVWTSSQPPELKPPGVSLDGNQVNQHLGATFPGVALFSSESGDRRRRPRSIIGTLKLVAVVHTTGVRHRPGPRHHPAPAIVQVLRRIAVPPG